MYFKNYLALQSQTTVKHFLLQQGRALPHARTQSADTFRESVFLRQVPPTERKELHATGYQLVPPSRSSISRDNDTPQVQNPIGAVTDTIVSAADEVVEKLGDLITPTTQGNDYAEAV